MEKKNVTIGGIVNKTTLGNKTGAWRSDTPVIGDKCTGCSICAQVCPEGCVVMEVIDGKRRAVIDYDYCKGCMICSMQCPVKTIEKK